MFDLRYKTECHKPQCDQNNIIKLGTAITAIAVNPRLPFYIVTGGTDGILRIFDRRFLSVRHTSLLNYNEVAVSALNYHHVIKKEPTQRACITSIKFDSDGNEILASFQPDCILLIDWRKLFNAETYTYDLNQNSHSAIRNTEKRFHVQTGWSDTGPDSLQRENQDYQSNTLNLFSSFLDNYLQNLLIRMNNSSLNNRSIEHDTADTESKTLFV